MIRILIIEDEMRAAKRLSRLLHDQLTEPITVTHFEVLDEGLGWLVENEIDLLFLDLNLNGEDGFEVLRRTTAESFHTIIVSAYVDKAIEAFEHGVLDFIPKPLMAKRLQQGLDRFYGQRSADDYLRYLSIRLSGQIKLLPVEKISYIKAAGHYSELFLTTGKKMLHDKSLDKLLTLLPSVFERVHKSYIVNFSLAERFRSYPGSRYQLEMSDGTVLPVGRTRFKALKKKLL